MENRRIERGDVFYIHKGKYSEIGSEIFSGRPGIIVSNNLNNSCGSTVEVAFCTAQKKKYLPTHVEITCTPRISIVMCEQVTSVSKERVGNYIGHCSEEEMKKIDLALSASLGITDLHRDKEKEQEIRKRRTYTESEVVAILRTERDTYRSMYEDLISRFLKENEA